MCFFYFIISQAVIFFYSPQKIDSETKPTDQRIVEKKSIEKKSKINKKLIFASSSDENDKGIKTQDVPSDVENSMIFYLNDSGNKIKVSYDSDDSPVNAKQIAANIKCSAPTRLMQSKKCKQLLTTCQKAIGNEIDKNDSTGLNPVDNSNTAENSKKGSKSSQVKRAKSAGDNNTPRTRKRRLMVPSQVNVSSEEDSSESISESLDVSDKTSPEKKHEKSGVKITQLVIPVPSDDSLAQAAKRESSV